MKRFRARWSSYEAQAAEAMPDLGTICPTSVGGDCTGGGMEPVPSTSYDDDPSWSGVAEYPPPPSDFVPTVEEEIDTLQAEPAEVERVYYYESLASGSYRQSVNTMAAGTQPLSIDDLIRLAGEGWTPMDGVRAQGLGTTLVGLPLGIALPYYYQWRIETAGNRAEQRASQYFPGNQGNTRADAFRHTFLSMQLRRYLTAPFAKLVTDKYEEQYSVRYPEEMMDKHNNTLGREAKYQYFRGHWFWDRWDWKEWAVRVRNYVADPANGEFIPEWAVDPSPAPEQVDTREQAVPTWKYIYISNG